MAEFIHPIDPTLDSKEKRPFVPRPVLLLAPPSKSGSLTLLSKDAFQNKVARAVSLYDALQGEGYDVRVLAPQAYSDGAGQMYRLTTDIEAQRPGSSIRIPVEYGVTRLMMLWPRDHFQVIGKRIFLPTIVHYHPVTELLKKMGAQIDYKNVHYSTIGEGGFVVRSGNNIILAEYLKEDKNWKHLVEDGYTVDFIPNWFDKESERHEHIDIEFNLAEGKNGNKAAVVSAKYYKDFEDQVKDLTNRLDTEVFVTDEFLAPNFITLPDSRIAIPNHCPNTQAFMRSRLGDDQVIGFEADEKMDYEKGGGWRCKSNLVV